MKITAKAQKGFRIYKSKSFMHNTHKGLAKVRRPFLIEIEEFNWWFDVQKGEWVHNPESYYGGLSSSYYAMSMHEGLHDVYSLKAVKRLIHKWNVPKGTKFVASLPFVGHEFIITKP